MFNYLERFFWKKKLILLIFCKMFHFPKRLSVFMFAFLPTCILFWKFVLELHRWCTVSIIFYYIRPFVLVFTFLHHIHMTFVKEKNVAFYYILEILCNKKFFHHLFIVWVTVNHISQNSLILITLTAASDSKDCV